MRMCGEREMEEAEMEEDRWKTPLLKVVSNDGLAMQGRLARKIRGENRERKQWGDIPLQSNYRPSRTLT